MPNGAASALRQLRRDASHAVPRQEVNIAAQNAERIDKLRSEEKERSQERRDGTWRHLWRIVGEYANISMFSTSRLRNSDVASAFPCFMRVKVTPLCRHPSADRFGWQLKGREALNHKEVAMAAEFEEIEKIP